MNDERIETPRAPGPTRVALVGAGFIADFHLEVLRALPGVELVAVCDGDRARAESAARRFGVPRAVGSIEELPALQVEIAHVLVPPDAHVAVTRRLLELGIGAFVEKPLALASADARALGALAAERGLALGVNHNALFHPSFAELARRLAAGEIGRAEHVRVALSVPLRQLDAGDVAHWMFRAPRNIVFEQAVHPLAQLAAIIGRVLESHTTLLSTRELLPGQPFHDRWLVAARGERGTAEIYMAFGASFTKSSIEVIGSDGALEADLHHGLAAGETKTLFLDFWNSFLAGWRRGRELERSARRGLVDYLRFTLRLGPRRDAFFQGMQGSIAAFHAAVRARAPLPASAEDGARVLEWCESVASAAATARNAPVEIPPLAPARPGEIVVLGATGFIGRRVVERLRARGAAVTAVVRRAHSLPPILTSELAGAPPVRLVRAGLEDQHTLAEAVRGARCVLQLATGGGATWEAVQRSMVDGTLALARACLEEKVLRFVYVSSTAALYLGPDVDPPIVEDSAATDRKPETRSLYARGKIEAERQLSELCHMRGLPLVIVRPGIVLGAGTQPQHSGLGLWVRDNHCVGWGLGQTSLPLVHVDDVAEALARAAVHLGGELDGKALNLAAKTGLSAAEVVAEMARASGRAFVFHPRPLARSQAMEIGKWLVKRAGGRKAPFPSWRDLKSRTLTPELTSRTARELLEWKPVEDPQEFLELAVRAPLRREAQRGTSA